MCDGCGYWLFEYLRIRTLIWDDAGVVGWVVMVVECLNACDVVVVCVSYCVGDCGGAVGCVGLVCDSCDKAWL